LWTRLWEEQRAQPYFAYSVRFHEVLLEALLVDLALHNRPSSEPALAFGTDIYMDPAEDQLMVVFGSRVMWFVALSEM
jgi:hypothetical protein